MFHGQQQTQQQCGFHLRHHPSHEHNRREHTHCGGGGGGAGGFIGLTVVTGDIVLIAVFGTLIILIILPCDKQKQVCDYTFITILC